MPASPYELVHSVSTLVSLPEVYLKVSALINDPDTPLAAIGKVIEQDPGLSARLLKIVNSPFYGFTSKIDTITRALTVIGTNQLRDLVLATSATRSFKGLANDLVTMENFWAHSLLCGISAKHIGKAILPRAGESLFVSGLLHDVGQLVMFSRMQDSSRKVLEMVENANVSMEMSQAESKIMGFDHAKVGGELLKSWRLPANIQEAVEFHHQPEKAPNHPMEAAIVNIANVMAQLAELRTTDHSQAPPPRSFALQQTGFNDKRMDDMQPAILEEFASMKELLIGQ